MRKIQVLTAPRRKDEQPRLLGMIVDPEQGGKAPFGLAAGKSLMGTTSEPQIAFERYWAGWSNGYIQTRAVVPE